MDNSEKKAEHDIRNMMYASTQESEYHMWQKRAEKFLGHGVGYTKLYKDEIGVLENGTTVYYKKSDILEATKGTPTSAFRFRTDEEKELEQKIEVTEEPSNTKSRTFTCTLGDKKYTFCVDGEMARRPDIVELVKITLINSIKHEHEKLP